MGRALKGMKKLAVVWLSVLWLGPPDALGQEAVLASDRPDYTDGTSTVAAGHQQLEIGVEIAQGAAGLGMQAPMGLLRVGLSDSAEVRLGLPGVSVEFDDNQDASLVGGISLGAKLARKVADDMGVALIPSVEMPVATGQFAADGISAGAAGALQWDFAETAGVGVNLAVGLGGVGSESDLALGYLASLSLGVGVSDEVGVFAEAYCTIDDDGAVPVADGGLLWLLAPHLQVDVYGGVTLEESISVFGGAGVVLLR